MGLLDMIKGPDFDKLLEQAKQVPNAWIIDVRTREEYQSGHVPGAKNIPLDEISGFSAEKETPLYLYCRSGARSSRACSELKGKGYHSVVNMGGILAYHGPKE